MQTLYGKVAPLSKARIYCHKYALLAIVDIFYPEAGRKLASSGNVEGTLQNLYNTFIREGYYAQKDFSSLVSPGPEDMLLKHIHRTDGVIDDEFEDFIGKVYDSYLSEEGNFIFADVWTHGELYLAENGFVNRISLDLEEDKELLLRRGEIVLRNGWPMERMWENGKYKERLPSLEPDESHSCYTKENAEHLRILGRQFRNSYASDRVSFWDRDFSEKIILGSEW